MRNVPKDGRLSSVATAVTLLKCFTDETYELGIGALSRQLGVAKSTVHRLASTLLDAGMLDQNRETGKYRLGLTLFELGSLVRRKMDLYNEAKHYLHSLRAQTGKSVNLAVLRDDSLVYLNSLESQSAIRVRSNMGLRMPAHCTAEGKVLLAYAAPETVARVISNGLEHFTPGTIADPEVLQDELRTVRERGYAVDYEEREIGVRAAAMPIFGADGDVVAAIGVAGPIQRVTKRMLNSFLAPLGEAADAISLRLGASSRAVVSGLKVVKS